MKKRIFNSLFLVLIFFSFIPTLLFSQVDTAWVRRYNGPRDSADVATSLFVDNNGNVYVTGRSVGLGTNYDYATLKYDSIGNLLWVRRYNGSSNGEDIAIALFVDGAGNVYVTGYSDSNVTSYDYLTLKYDTYGNLLWARRYGVTRDADDTPYALFVDGAGNVYVTGSSWGGVSWNDYLTLKYDTDGNLLWARRYNGQGNAVDCANALFVDGAGNVYVTGYSVGLGTNKDYATLKYDMNGNLLWERRHNGQGNDEDLPKSLFVDNQGNVYVTGYSWGSGTGWDYATLKYDTDGNLLWERTYNGTENSHDHAYALFVDANGNVYITGDSYASGTNYDYTTIKYVPQGPSINKEKENKIKNKLPRKTNEIYDVCGKLVKQNKLKKGIYFLRTEKENKKIIILK